MEDLLNLPLICSRQGITEDFPKWFGEKVDRLNIVGTFNLAYNAGVLVREGMCYALSFDKLINTTGHSNLCFRPLEPALLSSPRIVWKKYQIFSKAAEKFLATLQSRIRTLQEGKS